MIEDELINVLIVESHAKTADALITILRDNNTIFIQASSAEEAFLTLEKIEVGLILLNIDIPNFNEINFLDHLRQKKELEDIYTIVYSDDFISATKFVKGLNEGAVDYITKPFNPNLIKAKINVYKSFYFKDRKIDQLLSNILPKKVIISYENQGFYTPTKIDKGVVLFTDFVQFSNHASHLEPLPLLRELDMYFSYFDEIMERFQIEKIKTIGDAYMALAGVNHTLPHPIVRSTLAALEIRNWMINKNETAKALNLPSWQIRIGMHAGPLIAGVIGQKKITFDVWGDTVNIASRAEQNSLPNEINVTRAIAEAIEPYFEIESRGEMEIAKRGGAFELFFIKNLKPEFSMMGEGRLPNAELRRQLGLPTMDFEYARKEIIDKLKSSLPDELTYHSIEHILNVEKSATTIARMEGISGTDLIILRTAVILHDSGYTLTDAENEKYAIELAKSILPKYGYSPEEVSEIEKMIHATKRNINPSNLLEEIICDANLDYLGRADYYEVAENLRTELANRGRTMTDIEWLKLQINYLENIHQYYTNTAKYTREQEKLKRLKELKLALKEQE